MEENKEELKEVVETEMKKTQEATTDEHSKEVEVLQKQEDEESLRIQEREQKMRKKKRIKAIVTTLVVLLVLAGIGVGVFFFMKNRNKLPEETVYTCEVAEIIKSGDISGNRYMGIVESQDVKKITKDNDKKIKEVFVKVEDEVKKGDVLFEYDMQELELQLKQLRLELQSINDNIATTKEQINLLTAEKANASEDEQYSYSAQIQAAQAQLNQYNYDANAKNLDIEQFEKNMEDTQVTATMDGVIKSIGSLNDSGSDSVENVASDGEGDAFITIMAKGDYRIKATASELSVRSMQEGQEMIIRSRVDDRTWKGVIKKIDLEHPDTGNSDGEYYYGGGSSEATDYPFYITLEETEGLMLGQHVYVEMDLGQGADLQGLWLDEFYIMMEDDGKSYVWKENAEGRIEKRQVELGQYDENLMKYEILSGLSETDYIAFPEPRLKDGMKTTHNYEDVVIHEASETDAEEDMMYEDGYYEEGDTFDMDDSASGDILYEDDMDFGGEVQTGSDADMMQEIKEIVQ